MTHVASSLHITRRGTMTRVERRREQVKRDWKNMPHLKRKELEYWFFQHYSAACTMSYVREQTGIDLWMIHHAFNFFSKLYCKTYDRIGENLVKSFVKDTTYKTNKLLGNITKRTHRFLSKCNATPEAKQNALYVVTAYHHWLKKEVDDMCFVMSSEHRRSKCPDDYKLWERDPYDVNY